MTAENSSEALSEHLRQLEESLLQPDVRKSSQLLELLADDFLEFGSSGRVYTKAAVVALLQAETPGTQALDNFRATLLAPDVALVTYEVRRDGSPPIHTLRSSIWRLRDGRWQIVFHQGTRTSPEFSAKPPPS